MVDNVIQRKITIPQIAWFELLKLMHWIAIYPGGGERIAFESLGSEKKISKRQVLRSEYTMRHKEITLKEPLQSKTREKES